MVSNLTDESQSSRKVAKRTRKGDKNKLNRCSNSTSRKWPPTRHRPQCLSLLTLRPRLVRRCIRLRKRMQQGLHPCTPKLSLRMRVPLPTI